jgi:hypothetical protein
LARRWLAGQGFAGGEEVAAVEPLDEVDDIAAGGHVLPAEKTLLFDPDVMTDALEALLSTNRLRPRKHAPTQAMSRSHAWDLIGSLSSFNLSPAHAAV